MNEKNQQESFRRWGYGLAAAASVVAAITCFAGGRRTEKSGVRLISGLLWLAGAAGWVMCLLRGLCSSEPRIKRWTGDDHG